MYYYQHHIGDFDRATRHLTRIERSVYLDLLFVYYETEKALTLDQAALCRKIVARGEEERQAVAMVLAEFFHETPCGWFHDRCEEEIAEYQKKQGQASNAGKASAAARAARRKAAMTPPPPPPLPIPPPPTATEQNGNENPTTVERTLPKDPTDVEQALNGRGTGEQREGNDTPTNQEPGTSNQEPVNSRGAAPSASPAAGEDSGQKVDKPKPDPKGTRLPEDWKPTPEEVTYCKTERPDLRPSEVATRFYNHWRSKPGKDGRKLDWHLTWCNWVLNERRGAMAPAGKQASRHGGFAEKDYTAGVNPDGTF